VYARTMTTRTPTGSHMTCETHHDQCCGTKIAVLSEVVLCSVWNVGV
jgi:hypothetical protein